MILRILLFFVFAWTAQAQCTYQLGLAAVTVPAAGGSEFVVVNTQPGCAWTAVTEAGWVTLSANAGTGIGGFQFLATANDGLTRTAVVVAGTAALTITQTGVAQNALPEVRSVTPANGTGLTQTFQFTFRDHDGASDILRVQAQVHDVQAPTGCLIYYTPDSGEALIINPAGGWIGPRKLGVAGTLDNAYCSLDTGASSATPTESGALFILNLKLTFSTAFAGQKQTFAEVLDRSGPSSGYQYLGAWTLPGGGILSPTVVSLTPNSGGGVSQTFTARFTDPDGASDIDRIRFSIGPNTSGQGGCLIEIRPRANQALLIADDGVGQLGPVTIGGAGLLENSQCAVDNGAITMTLAGDLILVIPVTFKPAASGTQTLALAAVDVAGNGSGFQSMGSFNVLIGLNQPPQAQLATPNIGTGSSQTFQFRFRDPNGATDIQRTQLKFSTNGSNTGACLIYVDRVSGNMALLNDTGQQFSTGIRAGTPGTLENSQCMVDTSKASMDINGLDLIVNVAVAFKSSFTGLLTITAEALDFSFLTSGYQLAGIWTVPSVGSLPPTVVSISPNSGAGVSQTFRVTASDPNGAADIQRVLLNVTGGSATCLMEYTRSNNSVSITLGPELPAFVSSPIGANGQLIQTSTCSLNAAAVVVSGSGTTLTVDFPVSFKAIFAGVKDLRANVVDALGLTPGERSFGSYTALQGGNEAPSLISVTPASGGGVQQVFAFRFSDPNGATDILRAQVIIYDALAPTGCLVYYDRVGGGLLLMRDDGLAWLGPARLGTAGTLTNSFCTVNAGTSSAVVSGAQLTLNLDITFASSFTGIKQIWVEALDSGGLAAGYSQLGTFTVGGQVGNQPPVVLPPDALYGLGQANTFTFRFNDANGATDIQRVQMRVGTGANNAGACLVYFNRLNNQISLLNDAGTAFSTGVAIKSATRLQNSQCIVDAASTRSTASGATLTVDLSLRFTAAFESATPKDVAVEALDMAGLSSGYQTQGQWQVQRALPPNGQVAVSPEGGSGLTQTFRVTLSNPNGSADTVRAQIQVNRAFVSTGSCLVYYDAVNNSLALLNDAGTAFSNGITIGASGTLQNAQCSLNVANAAVAQTGVATLLDLPITFKTAFGGQRAFYVEMLSAVTGSTGYGLNGYWFVPF